MPARRAAPPPPPPKPKKIEPPPAAAFLRESDIRTSLDADAIVNGKLSFNSPTRIEGKLKGELRSTSLVEIGPTAIVEGRVRAKDLRIEGHIRGDVEDTERVEILPTGKIYGEIETDRLVLHDGGIFEGRCRTRPSGESRGRRASGD